MSLLASASPWTNDDSNNNQKKRIPTLRKPGQKPQQEPNQQPVQPSNQYQSINQSDELILKVEEQQNAQSERNERVNQLINQLSLQNDGNKLADFQPLTHPAIQKRTDSRDSHSVADEIQQNLSLIQTQMHHQMPQSATKPGPGSSHFSAATQDLGILQTHTNPYSNYRNVYDAASNGTMHNLMTTTALPSGNMGHHNNRLYDDKLMEKINYMIHMLEQQHNEKTSNITEEFVLYTFLGVFIIFIVDSFARAGKYVR
jgi:hypothetical protein